VTNGIVKKEKVKKINKTNLYLIISIIILGFSAAILTGKTKS